jgi:hypothetical protein
MLPTATGPENENLLPGSSDMSFVPISGVGPSAQEMTRVQPILLDGPRQVSVGPAGFGKSEFAEDAGD